jgi:protocatechuate 3,4-dioxygenase beta subunit
MVRVILILLLAVVPVFAQEPPPAPGNASAPVAEKDKCTVEGKVLDASSGKPLKKAVVTLFPMQRRANRSIAVTTDADGIFIFKSVDPGSFRLSAARRGYVTQQYGQTTQRRGGAVLELAAGKHLKDVVLRLQVGAAIAGRIFDEDGEPMSNVQVSALRHTYRDGRPILAPTGFATSNDLGEYRIFGLAPGEYFIRAAFTGNGFMPGGFAGPESDQAGDSTYAPTFYPGVQDSSQAAPINLRPSDDTRADITLNPARAFSIRGKVINTAGTQGRATLMLMPRQEMDFFTFGPRNMAPVTADGSFEFHHVLPGSYTINGRTNDEKGQSTARQSVEVGDRDVNNVIVALRPANEISGRFSVTGSFQGRVKELRVSLQPDSGMMMGDASASAKDDGSFVLNGVSDDVYRITVGGLPSNAYIRAVRYGSEDIMQRGFDPAGGHESLDIIISADGGRISGLVSDKDQNAQSGITVVAVPDQPLRWISAGSKTISSDQNGRFNLQGLRPGRYRLYGFEDIEAGAYDDPQFMKKYLDSGKAVDVTENSQQTIDLTVIPREENQ